MARGTLIFISVVGLLLIIGVAYSLYSLKWHDWSIELEDVGPESISSIRVEKPYFLIEGNELSKVEVWAVPTGTNITEKDHVFLGQAEVVETEAGTGMWRMKVPIDPLLVTEIYAKGFRSSEGLVGKTTLPHIGATDIYNALWWGEASTTYQIRGEDNGKTFTYTPTSRFIVILDQDLYTNADISCDPPSAVGEISNIPTIEPPLYATRYEAVRPGMCVLESGGFKVTITIKE